MPGLFRMFSHRDSPPEPPKEGALSLGTARADWRTSPPHLILLARFLVPRQSQDAVTAQDWTTVLGESPETAIRRFVDSDLIKRGDLTAHLIAGLTTARLKGMLKERSLPQSGTKASMAARLIDKDPEGAKLATSRLEVLVCTENGKSMAEAYVHAEELRRVKAIDDSKCFLMEGNYHKAAKTVVDYEANSVFPRGMMMTWDENTAKQDEAVLQYIFTRVPKLSIKRGWDKLPGVPLVAGMAFLWGNTQNARLSCPPEIDAAAKALWSYAKFLREMEQQEQLRKSGIAMSLQLQTCNDSIVCEACNTAARHEKYSIDTFPELPLEDCSSENGCRCWFGAMLE